ncbi:MAG: trypsin-like peptidase domain-containing protein [Pirellulales bacterium]
MTARFRIDFGELRRAAACGLRIATALLSMFAFIPVASAAGALEPDAEVLGAEAQRIETIERISRPTLAIFGADGQGGGSGVVISPDGYALTNFHVVAPTGPAMKCGLSDGRLVDAVLVGLDPGGDVALIKLLGDGEFPAADLGDSDAVHVGDWAYVAGNPFLLADNFKPTITYGIISGIHRYQYPAGTLLEYADCLQTDAAINPGNSGGPMFDAAGRLIGVNGRGSFEKRGRVNVGVGYAISINQIKRFLGLLKSGRIVDHASLGATVTTDEEGRVVVDDILDDSDAFRRGLRYGDELVRFGGREIGSANTFKNVLGTYPAGWRVPMTFRRDGREFERVVRLAGVHRGGELEALLHAEHEPPVPDQPPRRNEPLPPGDPPRRPPEERRPGRRSVPQAKMPRAVRDHYEVAPGYANYWFNRYHQQRVWNAYLARGDFAETGWDWKIGGNTATGGAVTIELAEKSGSIVMPDGQSGAQFGLSLTEEKSPPRSGGLLAALHLWQRLLLFGPRRFGEVYYLGTMPWPVGPAVPAGTRSSRPAEPALRDCLVATHGGVETRFYFNPDSGDLVGIEMQASDDEDPCEIYFSDVREVDGRHLPHQWTIRHGDELFAELKINSYDLASHAPSKDKE